MLFTEKVEVFDWKPGIILQLSKTRGPILLSSDC